MSIPSNLGRRPFRILPIGALLLGALLLPRATDAQELARATVDRVALSADTIGIGDRFDLIVELTIPAGTVAYLPDSIQSAAFESVEAYRWERTDSPDGVVVRVTYPLIAFQVGTITTPDFEAFVALGDVSVAAGGSAPGDVVGEWSVLAEDPSAYAGSRMLGLPSRSLWVGSVLLLDEITEGLAPRPPADVAGGNRDWVATMGLLLFGSLFLVMSISMARDWLAARSRAELAPLDPKSEALLALDTLRGDRLLGLALEPKYEDAPGGGQDPGILRTIERHRSRVCRTVRRRVESLPDEYRADGWVTGSRGGRGRPPRRRDE